jgi:hypothetical protein
MRKTKRGYENMKHMKISVVLLALLLAAMAIVPCVSAMEITQVSKDDRNIIDLFEPVNDEIQNTVATSVTREGIDKTIFDLEGFLEKMVKKYQKNLDLILDSLESKTGQKLSLSEREDLKRIIILEHIERVSWAQFKEKLGVKDEDFVSLYLRNDETEIQSGTMQKTSSIVPLRLVQVADDVNGGAGIDGGGRPYNVNGNNILFDVTADTGYSGKILYECHFTDEDVPYPAGDASYDLFRLQYYGTLIDVQGFFIRDPDSTGTRYIEFGNDWDNGNSYGTVAGQHGTMTSVWNVGDSIFISNVWNHAMGLADRNSNMAKWTHIYN